MTSNDRKYSALVDKLESEKEYISKLEHIRNQHESEIHALNQTNDIISSSISEKNIDYNKLSELRQILEDKIENLKVESDAKQLRIDTLSNEAKEKNSRESAVNITLQESSAESVRLAREHADVMASMKSDLLSAALG